MAKTVTYWIAEMSKYPPDTVVDFISNCILFTDPATGKDARPRDEVRS